MQLLYPAFEIIRLSDDVGLSSRSNLITHLLVKNCGEKGVLSTEESSIPRQLYIYIPGLYHRDFVGLSGFCVCAKTLSKICRVSMPRHYPVVLRQLRITQKIGVIITRVICSVIRL